MRVNSKKESTSARTAAAVGTAGAANSVAPPPRHASGVLSLDSTTDDTGADADLVALAGRPEVCAPELLLGGSISTAVDLWSLGCLLYHVRVIDDVACLPPCVVVSRRREEVGRGNSSSA